MAASTSCGHDVEVVEVGGHHHGPAPGRLDLLGHLDQLLLGAGRDDDVGARLGQGQGGGGADAPSGPGDDGDAVGEPETVQDHRRRP